MGNSQSNSSHYNKNSSSEENNIAPNSTPAYLDPNSLGGYGTTNSSPNLNQHAQPKSVSGKDSSSSSNRKVQIHKSKGGQNASGYSQYSNSPFVGSPLIPYDEFDRGNHENLNPHFSQASYLTNRRNLSQPDTFPSSIPSALSPLTKAQDLNYTPEGSIPNQSGLGTLQPPAVEIEQNCIINKEGVPTLICWSQGGKQVYITGTFNDWKYKIPLTKSENDFTTVLNFLPGTHYLKFIVDDEWKCSNELLTGPDPDGNLVNYIEVSSQGSNEFDGLETEDHWNDSYNQLENEGYTTGIPDFNNFKGPNIDRPPHLPAQLQNVLLNEVSSEQNEVNNSNNDTMLLPTPNHVVLNHLYACSIRDNIMAVAITTRYRKKYITTLFYKPVSI